MATKAADLLAMSDDDIANLNEPPVVEAEAAPSGAAEAAADAGEALPGSDDEPLTDAEKAAQAAGDDDEPDADAVAAAAAQAEVDAETAKAAKEAADAEAAALAAADEPDDVVAAKLKPDEVKPVEKKANAKAEPATVEKTAEELAAEEAAAVVKAGDKKEEAPAVVLTPADHEAFYKQIMAPFKANGKTIQLKSPEEVVGLMQMGANYTRKMQDIQGHRKVLTMLENNDLLDEGKLSFLIDLDKKDPAAIQKLIKDSGIDPLDIDVTKDPSYSPGDHQVSDEEVGFRSVMEDLKSDPLGTETLSTIHDTWDNASKQALWSEPAIMSAIHDQRQSGVYDLITTEMDRRRTLGLLPANTSFLMAYKTVGDEMMAELAVDEPPVKSETAPASEETPQVIATRAAAPKKALANGDKAAAASLTKSSPKSVKVIVNPLSMSDEDIMKLNALPS